jgi:hypothetical protein
MDWLRLLLRGVSYDLDPIVDCLPLVLFLLLMVSMVADDASELRCGLWIATRSESEEERMKPNETENERRTKEEDGRRGVW